MLAFLFEKSQRGIDASHKIRQDSVVNSRRSLADCCWFKAGTSNHVPAFILPDSQVDSKRLDLAVFLFCSSLN
ncbi:hypothetical protein SAMN06265368_4813 [Cohaesibacter gelatinilyticus]|uniref:Uncharacterized protein n=1 Tax=Cohaesibacter gelatinilyticus TaxID=372072 RepID=A0A285PJU6_9HYPH|nr:hypothetical protein SAMN06265368_4813 [Cohaesibacter gelatinilyticus]